MAKVRDRQTNTMGRSLRAKEEQGSLCRAQLGDSQRQWLSSGE